MFSSFTFLLASAVVAQAASSSASADTSSPTSSPYIPTAISSTCQDYLVSLDSDSDLAACTPTLLAASSAFGPGGQYATGASKDAITSALSDICSPTTSSCSQSLMSGKLAKFYTQCAQELTSQSNEVVMTLYDIFFVALPLVASVCSKDGDGNYCVFSTNVNSSATPAVAYALSGATAYFPNATTIAAQNLVFLGIDGSEDKAQLCTTCTKNVLTNYVAFQEVANYGPGLPYSPLMGNEPTLYSSVVKTCGANFFTTGVQAAGGLGEGSTTTGSSGALSLRAGAGGVLSTLAAALVAALIL